MNNQSYQYRSYGIGGGYYMLSTMNPKCTVLENRRRKKEARVRRIVTVKKQPDIPTIERLLVFAFIASVIAVIYL